MFAILDQSVCVCVIVVPDELCLCICVSDQHLCWSLFRGST